MRNEIRRLLLTGAIGAVVCAAASTSRAATDARAQRQAVLRDTRATYCQAPRTPELRVDVDRLVSELVDLHANTYSFCIHMYPTDWEDLKLILPKTRAKGIQVWASLVPPSESPPRTRRYCEPFRLDYHRWAIEFARLSLQETNLVAWSIDDFTHNLKFYSTNYVNRMLQKAREINPRLAFVPCSYYTGTTPQVALEYGPLLDGILFPYRHESAGANLKDPSLVEQEIKTLRGRVGPDFPIVLDIYATAHSRLGATTPQYVEEAMISGHRAADGVMIYCHQDPKKNPEKYQIIKRQFGDWSNK